jgi:hypothetical protein
MSRSSIVALISVALSAAVFAPIAMAQMRGAGMSMRGARAPSGFGHNAGVGFAGRSHLHSFGAIFLGDPFYADYPGAPLTIPSQFVATQPEAAADAPLEPKSEPLMIELQGNRYLRFGGRQQLAEPGSNAAPGYAEAQAPSNPQVPQPRARPELPTVLIFRDGHREQVSEYAIIGSTLYANGDYWDSGYWTKSVQLSALNIPATMKANHDNGVKFTLPSAPNEVITRP